MNLRAKQFFIFCLGWLAYASTYLLRKPLGVISATVKKDMLEGDIDYLFIAGNYILMWRGMWIKSDIELELSAPKTVLGWMDTALLFPYAVMQMFLGHIGDRIGARLTLGGSLILAGASMITFGNWNNVPTFCFLLFINGAAQSQCWPNSTKILLSWFADDIRNTVFGMYGTCAFSGGIIGTMLAVYLQTTYGWRTVFLPPAIIAIVLGILVLTFYRHSEDVNIEIPGRQPVSSSKKEGSPSEVKSLFGIWKIPMVPEIAIAVFCIKVVRYCMYMWLPLYLLRQLKYSKGESGMFSTVFDIGGVVGSASIGFVIDRFFNKRSILGNAFSIGLACFFLIMFNITSAWGKFINSLFMFLAGAFSSGPDVLLAGSIAAELGELGNRNAAVATVGLINGFGSVGTFIEGPVIGIIATNYGWTGMFYFMIALTAIGTLSCLRAAKIHSKAASLSEDIIL